MPPSPEFLKERLAEAARYALLRRLAPALRHDMAGALQPISMLAAMLEKRLQKPEPDLAALGKSSNAINTLAREASASCMSLMTWLAPREDAPLPLNSGIADSLALVATELSFRGFNLVNKTADVSAEVLLSGVRGVFMAGLMALTDSCSAPADVVLTAGVSGDEVVVDMALVPTSAGEPVVIAGTQSYRALAWDDVEAMAVFQAIGLAHGPSSAQLRYRRA